MSSMQLGDGDDALCARHLADGGAARGAMVSRGGLYRPA
jgi:hypothetical protein